MNKTAVLVDFSHLFHRYLFANKNTIEQNFSFLAHLLLNSLIDTIDQFKINKSNVLILALDGSRKDGWRRKVFPFYKANRDNKPDDGFDWKSFYNVLNDITDILRTSTDIHVIRHDNAEADDVIYVGTKIFKESIIISSDKDFLQLQSNTVKQFDPIKKAYINLKDKGFNDAKEYLKYHICMGDKIDNVPGIKKGWGEKTIKKNLHDLGSLFKKETDLKSIKEAYLANEILISLEKLPPVIDKDIENEYNSIKTSNYNYMNLFEFCKKHKLKKIMDNVQKFKFEENNNLNDFF